jgi:hypothetical protein
LTEPTPEAPSEVPDATDSPSEPVKPANREQKIKDLFEGRRYSIVREVHLGEKQRFVTPLGNRGRHGFLLQEDGTDYRIVVGARLLQIAAQTYGAVDLPPSKTRTVLVETTDI